MDEIRSWWRVPCIAHFCSLFRSAFGLTDFDIEDLEDALMISGGEENSRFLADLHARLLRGLFSKKADINADNFEVYLSEVLKVRWVEDLKRENPLDSKEYRHLATQEKVEILHGLCDWRLDVDDVPDLLKGMEADSLRVEPLGRDSANNIYWYFYGTRLYKEYIERTDNTSKEKGKQHRARKKKKKKGKKKKNGKRKKSSDESGSQTSSDSDSLSDGEDLTDEEEDDEDDRVYHRNDEEPKKNWSLVCSTLEEWESLAEIFSKSKNREEKNLHETLTVDFLAEIARMLEVKDKAFRKKLLVEMAPRRSSDRIAIKAQQKEDEDKQAEFERQQQKEREAEIKKQEAEEREKERQILAEKRQRERAERARLREERQWLIANGGDVPEELLLSLEKHDEELNDDDNEDSKLDELDKAFEGDVDMYTGMYKVLDSLKNHEDGWPFLEPVDESYAPNYLEIITNPMDLSTIEKKIDDKVYKGLKEFISDVKLMFKNCLEYNGEESSYTQMANTLENVFNRQMKKHFPDDDNPSSDEDFEEELTETELRKLNKKKQESKEPDHVNGMDNLIMAADIHRSNKDPTNTNRRIPDPNMFARHFGMMPMPNGRNIPPMAFRAQQMPYVGQPYYPQMYAGHPAYARFNMNNLARGAAPVFPAMMGMPHPGMAMGPRTSSQFPDQEMPTATSRGVPPVATKGEPSSSLWTDNRMQDMRNIGHPYPRHPLASPNTPWQARGLAPNPRQMMAGWGPGAAPLVNGMSEEAKKSFGVSTGAGHNDGYGEKTNERVTTVANQNDGEDDKNISDGFCAPMKPGGNQPSEDDLRYPFIIAQQQQQQQQRDANSLRMPSNLNTPSIPTIGNDTEGVASPVGTNNPRTKTPEDQGKVFTDLSSVRQMARGGEKRSNPYSVSSIIGNDDSRTKRPEEERLKFSTLLQEMSQGRIKPEGTMSPHGKHSPGPPNVAQFMDLSATRNHVPLVRQPQSIERPTGVQSAGDTQPMFQSYPKHTSNSHTPLTPAAVVSPSPYMDMRQRVDPMHIMNHEGHSFDPRTTLYQSYPSHGELQRQRMLFIQQQQQQQQQMMQRENFHPMGTMASPGNMPPDYAYLAQRPTHDAMRGRYKNGETPVLLDELTAKKPRVS